MDFLAANLAKFLHLEYLIDSRIHQSGFLQSQLIISPNRGAVISLVLENLLPAPKEEIPLKKLVKFKEKHESKLLAFRRIIKNVLTSVKSTADDENKIIETLNFVKDDIREQSLALDRKLKKIKLELFSMCWKLPSNFP